MLKVKNLLIQILIKKGQKNKAEKFLLEFSRKFLIERNQSFYRVILDSIKKVRHTLGFKGIRLSGVSCKVPVFLKKQEQVKTTLNFLCSSALKNKSFFIGSMVKELERSELEQGEQFVNRKKIFKLANQNKVFVHYR